MNFLNTTELPEGENRMFRLEANTYYNYGVSLNYDAYEIISRTLKGVWVVPHYMVNNGYDINEFKRFIRNEGKKRFAYETKEQALNSFLARKRRQITILKSQLHKAELAYAEAGGKLPLPTRDDTWFNEYN